MALERRGGELFTARLVGIASDGSIGFAGSCGEFATAQPARIAMRFSHADGESVLRAIIDDPGGPEAAALP